jgi:predicted pyridoxine 5'-phosphate oxidase superfamily flavin-nucleotide-binding protein
MQRALKHAGSGTPAGNFSKNNKGRTTYWTTVANTTGDYKMVKLNAEMKETFGKIKLFPVATASKSGVPNVAPIAFVMLVSDDTIWLADNYMHKTLANVKENPHIAIYLWEPDSRQCFQIKGKVEVKTSGPDYEKMKATVKAKKDTYPAKSLLVMKITDVFSCVPGAEPGKKLL